ncbi:DUF3102 domain-containing protein [Gimesia chilikensis]|uniref:DUF3102 domain-containing protein n=1 Tax=Gimesia chilikensis TaxID=2605989 RepID=UPI003A9265C7
MKPTRHELKHIDHELLQLKGSIQDNLWHCREANQAKLHHARLVGQDLIKAKKLVSTKRGKWTMWLKHNFDLSGQTARVYMRVAREWNHPDVIEHRNDGMDPKSIKSFLKLVKDEHREVDDLSGDLENNQFVVDPPEMKVAQLHHWLNSLFRDWLRDLNLTELEVFEHHSDILLKTLRDQLKDKVCKALEYDPYGDSTKLHAKTVKRIKKARMRKQSRADNQESQHTGEAASIPP